MRKSGWRGTGGYEVSRADNRTGDAPKKTTVAVALGYDPETDQAPKVVAGGRGAVAEQILAIAFARGIKVREDADLAELLSVIDVDTDIPSAAFAAVAEILIYVYRANGNWPSFLDPDRPREDLRDDKEEDSIP